MEVSGEWIDGDVPKQQTFSASRTLRLFLALMAASIVGGLPMGLYELWSEHSKIHQAEVAQQEKARLDTIKLQEAAREGKTGPAFQRLFGVDPTQHPPQQQ